MKEERIGETERKELLNDLFAKIEKSERECSNLRKFVEYKLKDILESILEDSQNIVKNYEELFKIGKKLLKEEKEKNYKEFLKELYPSEYKEYEKHKKIKEKKSESSAKGFLFGDKKTNKGIFSNEYENQNYINEGRKKLKITNLLFGQEEEKTLCAFTPAQKSNPIDLMQGFSLRNHMNIENFGFVAKPVMKKNNENSNDLELLCILNNENVFNNKIEDFYQGICDSRRLKELMEERLEDKENIFQIQDVFEDFYVDESERLNEINQERFESLSDEIYDRCAKLFSSKDVNGNIKVLFEIFEFFECKKTLSKDFKEILMSELFEKILASNNLFPKDAGFDVWDKAFEEIKAQGDSYLCRLVLEKIMQYFNNQFVKITQNIKNINIENIGDIENDIEKFEIFRDKILLNSNLDLNICFLEDIVVSERFTSICQNTRKLVDSAKYFNFIHTHFKYSLNSMRNVITKIYNKDSDNNFSDKITKYMNKAHLLLKNFAESFIDTETKQELQSNTVVNEFIATIRQISLTLSLETEEVKHEKGDQTPLTSHSNFDMLEELNSDSSNRDLDGQSDIQEPGDME